MLAAAAGDLTQKQHAKEAAGRCWRWPTVEVSPLTGEMDADSLLKLDGEQRALHLLFKGDPGPSAGVSLSLEPFDEVVNFNYYKFAIFLSNW